VSELIIY